MGPRVPLPQEQRPFSVLSLGQPQGTLPEPLRGAPDGEECLGCGLPRLHCCILELALDEMCIAKCSLFTCEMGVQVAVPDGLCVQVICADFPRAYSGAPPPPPGVGPSQPQCLLLWTSQIWTPVEDQRAVSPEAGGGGGEMLAS